MHTNTTMEQLINNNDVRLVEFARIQHERPEQFVCGSDVWSKYYNKQKMVVVQAEEKSGKRDITKCIALIDFKCQAKPFHDNDGQYLIPPKYALRKHIYIVGLNRKDIKSQLDELNHLNIDAYIIKNRKDADVIINEVKKVGYQHVVFHLDECDYAVGSKQSLSPIIEMIKTEENVYGVFYSATPEELTKSNFDTYEGVELEIVNFQPNANYRGAKWFLDNNLCVTAKPFFTSVGVLSEQAHECIAILHEHICQQSGRNIGVVRLAVGNAYTKFAKWFKEEFASLNKSNAKFYEKHMYIPKLVDKDTEFGWDMWEETNFHKDYAYIIFINQTCTRSTEITNNGHSRIAFWHDERLLDSKSPACYNTLSQAYGRVKHYHPIGHHIMVYGDVNVFRLSCGDMSWSEFDGKVAQRVNTTTTQIHTMLDDTTIEIVLMAFDTFEEANVFANGRLRDDITYNDDGKVLSSITSKKEVITEDVLKRTVANFRGTGGFCVGKKQFLQNGECLFRKYVGYTADGTLKFWVRRLTNISGTELPIKNTPNTVINTHSTSKKSAYHKT